MIAGAFTDVAGLFLIQSILMQFALIRGNQFYSAEAINTTSNYMKQYNVTKRREAFDRCSHTASSRSFHF